MAEKRFLDSCEEGPEPLPLWSSLLFLMEEEATTEDVLGPDDLLMDPVRDAKFVVEI